MVIARFQQPSEYRFKINTRFPKRFSSEQKADLDINITKDEIRKAVWNCGANKSPGPDGFTFEFFKRYWSLVGSEFCDAVECFFDKGFLPKGVPVGDHMTRIFAWDNVLQKSHERLSKWKSKTLSIGGRLTLLKSVLGATPLYTMSIYKAPKRVLQMLETIHSKFFYGADSSEKKITWIAWEKVLASKKHRVVLRMLVFIKAIYGPTLESHAVNFPSPWYSILREVLGDTLSERFPRLFALENNKQISIASKWGEPSLDSSFRRPIRGGVKQQQWSELLSFPGTISFSSLPDRWVCDLNGDGVFSVKHIRSRIDDLLLPSVGFETRWVKFIPIKVNIFVWRARLDRLPTRCNLSDRGVPLNSMLCPLCGSENEDSPHVFFRCELAKLISRKVCRWWDLSWNDASSFIDWFTSFSSIWLPAKLKLMLEGVFYVAWWHIWVFRNRLIFKDSAPRRSVIFDDIVSRSFTWCGSRCSSSFSWDSWFKNPNLISL
ncbi:RNA-directed DNA polymerase, eukaryota [Tanacetum coccineum]